MTAGGFTIRVLPPGTLIDGWLVVRSNPFRWTPDKVRRFAWLRERVKEKKNQDGGEAFEIVKGRYPQHFDGGTSR